MIPKDFPTASPEPLVAESGGITFLALWVAIRRSWLLILAIFAASVLIAGLGTLRQRKIYRSSSTIEIAPSPPRPLGSQVQTMMDSTGSYWNNKEYYETQLRIITSSTVLLEVVRRLNLNGDGGFIANLPAAASPTNPKTSVEAARGVLASRISLEPVKNSRLVMIHVEDANPGRGQRILSTLVDTYLDQNIDTALASATSSGEWLANQLTSLKGELEKTELELYNYKKSHNILSLSLDEQSNMLRGEMAELNSRVTQVREKIEQISARYNMLKQVDPNNPSELPATELLGSGALQQLRQRYVELSSRRVSLLAAGKGENHPETLSTTAQQEVVRNEMLQEMRNVQLSLERDLAATRQEAAGLKGLFKAAEQRALDVNLLELDYRKREREKVNTERLYTLVLERSKESDLTRMMRFNNLRVIEPASAPRRPIRPSVPTNMTIGGAFGILLGIAFAVARDRFDRSIKSAEGVEQLGIPFLGTLPEVGAQTRSGSGYPSERARRRRRAPNSEVDEIPELVAHRLPAGGVAEASRAIRTSIRFSSPDHPYRCLLVTSAGPAEGKTTVACCIAISMAQAGQRTLILDCDLRRPRLHKVFGASCDRGTTDAIIDPSVLESCVLETSVANLYLLPAGRHAPNPADLINSERFGEFLKAVRSQFDTVIIDSAPILPVTDSTILSTRVDGTVLIIRAGKTTKERVAKAVRTLKDVGGAIAGGILNGMVENPRGGDYYYQYYGRSAQEADPSTA
jgi:capsular exopolysaccharide synthesis family protein